jgi:hypothetical protein
LYTKDQLLTTSSKRRRNTEASARFRAKKKEREQAVEKRASKFVSFIFIFLSSFLLFSRSENTADNIPEELEAQVSKLQSEKASLENENRLLKAIVLNGTGGQADALQGALSAFGKRKREA